MRIANRKLRGRLERVGCGAIIEFYLNFCSSDWDLSSDDVHRSFDYLLGETVKNFFVVALLPLDNWGGNLLGGKHV